MKLQVLNPVAQKLEDVQKKGALAPRRSKLEGKVLGLYWNMKPGGDTALSRVGELFKARYPGLETRSYMGSIGGSLRYMTKDDVARISEECTFVIGSTGD